MHSSDDLAFMHYLQEGRFPSGYVAKLHDDLAYEEKIFGA